MARFFIKSPPLPCLNPNRPLDCYAQTNFLFGIFLFVFPLQWNPIAPSKRKRNLLKNNSCYHHNANDRIGLNKKNGYTYSHISGVYM